MTFDDLPYKYRQFSEAKGWEEDQAIAYYQQAKEFREYLEAELCNDYRYYSISSSDTPDRGTFIINNILRYLRGEDVKIS